MAAHVCPFSARLGHKITSYYIPEASQHDDIGMVDLLSSPFLSSVTSLIVNQSRCYPDKKSIWVLGLSFRYSIDIIANKSIQVILADDVIYSLLVHLEPEDNKAKKSLWVLFHLMQRNGNYSQKNLLTELYVKDMKCPVFLGIKSLEVEFVKTGAEAIVYEAQID